jgi:hypothetical protein
MALNKECHTVACPCAEGSMRAVPKLPLEASLETVREGTGRQSALVFASVEALVMSDSETNDLPPLEPRDKTKLFRLDLLRECSARFLTARQATTRLKNEMASSQKSKYRGPFRATIQS